LVVFYSMCDFQDNCCVDQSSTATMCEKLHLLRGTCVVRTSALFDRCFVTGPEGIDINAALPLTISMAISAVLQYATHMVRYGRCCARTMLLQLCCRVRALSFLPTPVRQHGGAPRHQAPMSMAGCGGFVGVFLRFSSCHTNADLWRAGFMCTPCCVLASAATL
jgi:hypothetical protein